MAKQMMQDKASEMAATQTVPTGYKQTEVGVIPEDWDVVPFFDAISIASGQVSPLVEPYASMTLVAPDHIEARTGRLLAKESAKEQKAISGKYYFLSDDTVYSKIRPYLRKAAFVDFDGLCSADMYPLRAKSRIEPKLILPLILDERFSSYTESVSVRSGMPKINRAELADFSFALPRCKNEQAAIAIALSDSDALIESLEQLIAKKQAIKTAAMQQLLTGRTRLPQFALRSDGTPKGYKSSELGQIPEDWITPTLKGITSNIIDYRGRTPRKLGLEWGGGNILALSAGNVKKGFIDYKAECYFGSDELYKKWMTSGDASKDDIVFTMEAPLGNVALIPNEDKYILSQRTILLQLERSKFLPTFIIQVFLSDMFQSYISESATGSTAQGIKRATFEKMFVAVPSCLEEQTAIATILSDMDSELTALEQKLAKARDVKQGMMQQLLTGRIRLPLEVQA